MNDSSARATRPSLRRVGTRTHGDPPPEPPTWQAAPAGDGSMVHFRAIPMTMRALVWSIVGIVIAAGVLVAVLLIAVSEILGLGARLTIIVVGVGIALPLSLAFFALLRRRTVECTVAFGARELRVTTAAGTVRVPYRDLEHLRWRCDSEYARVEARTGATGVSLIVGIANRRPAPRRGCRRCLVASSLCSTRQGSSPNDPVVARSSPSGGTPPRHPADRTAHPTGYCLSRSNCARCAALAATVAVAWATFSGVSARSL